MQLWNGKYLVVRRDGTVPAWDWLVMGARDPYAPAALLGYASAIAEAATDLLKKSKGDVKVEAQAKAMKAYAQSVLDKAQDWEAYRVKEGAGDPLGQPWRKEADDVMRALNGETSVVVVMPDKDNSSTKPPRE